MNSLGFPTQPMHAWGAPGMKEACRFGIWIELGLLGGFLFASWINC